MLSSASGGGSSGGGGGGGKSSASNSSSASGSRASRDSAAAAAAGSPARAPRRTGVRTSATAAAAGDASSSAAAASQAAAPSIATPASQQQFQQITVSTPTQSGGGGARTITSPAAASAASPSPAPAPAPAPVMFHLPSDTPDQEEIRGSPVFSSQPPASASAAAAAGSHATPTPTPAPVPRLSPALRGFNAGPRPQGQVQGQGQRHPNGSPASSPNPSPRPSPSRSPSITATPHPQSQHPHGSAGSKRPSFSLHESRPVLDWKPYDPSGRSNVETILSPELREAQAAVAAKRAEADKIGRARYAHAGTSSAEAAAAAAATATPASPAAPASPNPPPHKRATHPSSSSAGGMLAVPPRKALPNATSEKTYDAAAEIFGSDLGPPEKAGKNGATAGTAAQRRQYGVAPASTAATAADASSDAATSSPSCFSRFGRFLANAFSGEIVMRTSPVPCFPSTTRSPPTSRRDAAGFRSAPVPRALGPPWGARWLYRLLEHSTPYTFFSIFLTVFSLFAYDFSVAFLPKDLDLSVAALLLACLVLFSLEILANCYAKANYCLVSFLFWLDVVGTFSLCFDVYWISQALFSSDPTTDNRVEWGDDGATAGGGAGGGESGQVARSASILRLTKFARVLRILKLVRIVRVFKFNAALQKTSMGSRTATPSKVGLTLSERQDKVVIGLVMLLLILAPFFQVVPGEDMSGGLGLQLLGETAGSLGVDRAGSLAAETVRGLFNDQLRAYINTQVASNHLVYLSLLVGQNTTASVAPLVTVYHQASTVVGSLRNNEFTVFVYTSSLAASVGLVGGDSPGNVAIFSHRGDIFLESLFSLCYTLLVVLVFVFGSFLLNRDVQILVVQPLDRMTMMVKKLAGTILFLNQGGGGNGAGGTDGALSGLTSLNTSPRGGGGGGGGGMGSLSAAGGGSGNPVHSAGEIHGFETEAIEGMMAQIASIFNLVPDAHDPSSGLPKSFAMLSGSKHTQIKTLNSVVQIDVSERPREPGEDGDFDPSLETPTPAGSRRDLKPGAGRSAHNLHLAAHGGGGAGGAEGLPASPSGGGGGSGGGSPSLADFPELLSIDGILHNQLLLPYFKLFMTSSLTLENLLFVQEVDRFRTIVKLHVLNLYNSFISPRAHNQVNLPSLQRDAILSQLENPSACIFDEAQHECIGLMASFLSNFHASKYCRGYMARHRNRHHHVLKGAVKTGTSAGIGTSGGGASGPAGKTGGAVAGVVERVAGPMLTTSSSRHGTAHAAQLRQIFLTAGTASSEQPQQSPPLASPSNAPSLTVQLDAGSSLSPTHTHVPRLYHPAHAPRRPTLELKVGVGIGSQSASPRSLDQEQQLQLPGAVASGGAGSPVHARAISLPRSPASKSKEDALNRPRSTSPMAGVGVGVPPRDNASPPPEQHGGGRAAISRRRNSVGGLSVPAVSAGRSPLSPAGADDAEDDEETLPARLDRAPTLTPDAARRSTGKRAAPVIQVSAPASAGGAVLVGESDLDAQIAALQASEGNRRSWVEREAAVQRQSLETAARRASFNRHKSMGAQTGNSIAQALDAAAAKREGRASPTTSTAGSTPPGRTPN